MSTVEAHFQVPDYIANGLQNGTYERVGGVVREHGTKQVIAWLRESAPEKLINFAPKLLHGGEAFCGVLNLGVSVCGFSLILNRLNKLESSLKKSQDLITQIDQKLDLSFYGNFVSAIKQANAAFQMNSPENRRHSAMQAIDRLLAAEHHFAGMVDMEIERHSTTLENLLPTISLAFTAEARCYLELEEIGMAQSRLDEGAETILTRYKKYIYQQISDPRAFFLHTEDENSVDMTIVTALYQWTDNSLTENEIQQKEKAKLKAIIHEEKVANVDDYKDAFKTILNPKKSLFQRAGTAFAATLSAAVSPVVTVAVTNHNNKRKEQLSLVPSLPHRVSNCLSMIEDVNRFVAYRMEVEGIRQSGLTFADWRSLKPEPDQNAPILEIMCITPSSKKATQHSENINTR